MASGSVAAAADAQSASTSTISNADLASNEAGSGVRDPTVTRLRRFVRKFAFGRSVKSGGGGSDSISSSASTTSSDRGATSSGSGATVSLPPPTPNSADGYQRTQMLGLTSVGSDAFLDDDSLEDVDDVDDDDAERNYLKPFALPSWAVDLEPWIQDMTARSTRGLPWQFTTSDGARRLIVRHPTKPDKLLVYHEKRSRPRNDGSSADLISSEHSQLTVPSRYSSTRYPVFPSLSTTSGSSRWTPSSHESSQPGSGSVASARSSRDFDFTRYAAANVVSTVYSSVSKELGTDVTDRGAATTSPSPFVRGASGGVPTNDSRSTPNTFGQLSSRSSSYVEHSNSSMSAPLPSSRSLRGGDIHSERLHRVRNESDPAVLQLQRLQTQPPSP